MHPLLACGLGFFTGVVAYGLANARAAGPQVRLWGSRVVVLTVVQLVAGVVNVMLSAPGWMQVVHLLLGTTLWIAAVVFALHVVRPADPTARH
jgi:heme A synthase